MKKNSSWVLIAAVSIFLILGMNNKAYANINRNGDFTEKFYENQSMSLDTFFAVKEDIEKLDEYGGCYLDDAGNLNIWYVDHLAMIKQVVEGHTIPNQMVLYRKADYSFGELNNVIERLSDFMSELEIAVISLDDQSNRIRFATKSENYDEEEIYKLIGDREVLIYEGVSERKEAQSTYTVYNGGTVSSSSSTFSVAVGAVLNGEYGFITAAHCGTIGTQVNYNGVNLGYITDRAMGPNSEVAFIERSYSPNTFIATRSFIDGTSYSSGILLGSASYVMGGFPSGTAITKYGASTGLTTGIILSTNVSFAADSTWPALYHMVTASYQSSPGDSGGVVKAVWGSSTYAIGIHSGRVGTGYGNAFFSDMNWAKNDLGFGGYYD